jgi:lipid A ethanolaminephosphotransferase
MTRIASPDNRKPTHRFSFGPLQTQTVVFLTALFLLSTMNLSFFTHLLQTYGTSVPSLLKIATVALVFLAATFIILSLITFQRTLKLVLILVLLLSSQTAYFMDTYNVVIDDHMIQNILETNLPEARDLLNMKQLGYLILLGLAPSLIIYRIKIKSTSRKTLLLQKAKSIGIVLGIAVIIMLGLGKFYASFFREHKTLRFYSNPAYYLYSLGYYAKTSLSHPSQGIQPLGEDVRLLPRQGRKLIVVVVGEAARWDHFSLNGYPRETNPLLKHEDVINFPQFTSSGTETGVSVPSMFSVFGRKGYQKEKVRQTENILDILHRAGVTILWRDNNSDSKGVAVRLPYEDFRTSAKNTVCEGGECRDEGMLVGLQEYLAAHPTGDIVIVLHQMGNHGPAYYKRYPQAYEKFTPVCQSNQLEQCSQESIVNAYDNALLYTDYFLSRVIGFLKQNDAVFQTAMLYMSDHGESLGEKGLYLHGFPYAIAPEAQTHVGALAWFGSQYPVDKAALRQRAAAPYSHDYLFHTLLGMVGAQTSLYKPELDILLNVR